MKFDVEEGRVGGRALRIDAEIVGSCQIGELHVNQNAVCIRRVTGSKQISSRRVDCSVKRKVPSV